MVRPEAEDITINEITISQSSRDVIKDGEAIVLTDAEIDLLWLLAVMPGILSRDEIIREWRGLEHDGLDRTIDLPRVF